MSGQREQVLQYLRQAGKRGVHSAELRRQFIANPAERIRQLGERGYAISATPERSPFGRSMGVRYRLLSEPGEQPTTKAA